VRTARRLSGGRPILLIGFSVTFSAFPGCDGQIGALGGVSGVHVELLAPTRNNFEQVADAMQPHCGTLDCHGEAGRNMRLFGSRGLRLPDTCAHICVGTPRARIAGSIAI
jgi:hypothetical protein